MAGTGGADGAVWERGDTDAVRIGIDENGLGPRLGPLVVTAVVAATTGDGDARAESRPKGALRKRLDDSKKLVAYRDNALGEAWARAIARRMGHGGARRARRPSSACSRSMRPRCWRRRARARTRRSAGAPRARRSAATTKLLARVERDLAQLEDAGVHVTRAACVVTCTRRLNEGVGRGLTRFHMDLHAMERLTLEARERAGRDVVATCGKVGGFDRYSTAFGPLGGRLHAIAEEGRAQRVPTSSRGWGASRSCATPTRSTCSCAWRRWSASGCATC